MTYRYVPMLKTKAGEVDALTNLDQAVKQRVLPVFHVTTSVAASFAPGIGGASANRLAAVDGTFSFNTSGGTATFNHVIQSVRQHNVRAYPSIDVNAPANLVTAAANLVGADGVMVRTSLATLGNVAAFLGQQGWQPASVDLVIDAGHVAALPIPLLANLVTNTLIQQIPANSPYRSVSLSAAAAPKDHGDLPRGRSDVPRRDWALWSAVYPNVPFQLDYADYGTGHPDLTEPPGVAMASATVSARYTAATDWLIIKGRRTTGAQGLPMPQQYRAHAAHYVADQQFGGLQNCWGDDRIRQIDAGTARPGNRKSWVAIAANRHISMVVSQIP